MISNFVSNSMLKQIGKGISTISRISPLFRYTTEEKERPTFELEGPQSNSYKSDRAKKQPEIKSVNLEGCPSPPDLFMGMSEKPLDKSTLSVLHTEPEESEIRIRRLDGGLYVYYSFYQSLLNKAFGIGGWSIVPISKPSMIQSLDSTWCLIREYGLYCQGRFLTMGTGEAMFYAWTPQRSAILNGYEISKKDGLSACCKEIGMAQQLYMEDYVNAWRDKFAEKIMCEHVFTKVNKFLWRKKGQDTAISYPWRPISNFA